MIPDLFDWELVQDNNATFSNEMLLLRGVLILLTPLFATEDTENGGKVTYLSPADWTMSVRSRRGRIRCRLPTKKVE